MTDMLSPEYNLRAFCEAVQSADPLEAMEAASAEIYAAHRMSDEATGQFDFPVGSEVQVYCDRLQMVISTFIKMTGYHTSPETEGAIFRATKPAS